jgi:hypothetical protein
MRLAGAGSGGYLEIAMQHRAPRPGLTSGSAAVAARACRIAAAPRLLRLIRPWV